MNRRDASPRRLRRAGRNFTARTQPFTVACTPKCPATSMVGGAREPEEYALGFDLPRERPPCLGVNASCGPCPCCLVSRTAMWPTTEQEPGGRPTAAPPGSAGSRSPSQGRPRHDPRRSKAVGQSTPETLPRRQRGREPRVRGVRVAVSDERGRLAMHVTDGSPLLTLIGGAETEPSDIQDCAPIRSRYPDPNYRHMRAFLT